MEHRCFNPVSNWGDILAAYAQQAEDNPGHFVKVGRSQCPVMPWHQWHRGTDGTVWLVFQTCAAQGRVLAIHPNAQRNPRVCNGCVNTAVGSAASPVGLSVCWLDDC